MHTEQTGQSAVAAIASTATRLAAFAQTLTPAEQDVLSDLIACAVAATPSGAEVQGYFTLIEMGPGLLGVQALQGALTNAASFCDGSVRFGTTQAPPAGALLPAVQ